LIVSKHSPQRLAGVTDYSRLKSRRPSDDSRYSPVDLSLMLPQQCVINLVR
jgi:hypothetical protein